MKKELDRNRPEEKGRNKDPHVRDESAAQPGIQTMSEGADDEANESVTDTASENRNDVPDKRADRKFDD